MINMLARKLFDFLSILEIVETNAAGIIICGSWWDGKILIFVIVISLQQINLISSETWVFFLSALSLLEESLSKHVCRVIREQQVANLISVHSISHVAEYLV